MEDHDERVPQGPLYAPLQRARCHEDGSERARCRSCAEPDDGTCTGDRDRVLDEGRRPVRPEGAGEPASELAATRVPTTAPTMPARGGPAPGPKHAPDSAPLTMRAANCTGTVRLGVP